MPWKSMKNSKKIWLKRAFWPKRNGRTEQKCPDEFVDKISQFIRHHGNVTRCKKLERLDVVHEISRNLKNWRKMISVQKRRVSWNFGGSKQFWLKNFVLVSFLITLNKIMPRKSTEMSKKVKNMAKKGVLAQNNQKLKF